MRPISARRGERGTQIVEMALVLPLLLFIALVIIEGAAFVRTHQVINNAAREGAVLSSHAANFNGISGIKGAIIAYAAANDVSVSDGDITIDQEVLVMMPSGIYAASSEVIVVHNYNLRYLPGLPFFNVANNVQLQGAARFRNLY
jgi:Flp pilus assembly protein TadG